MSNYHFSTRSIHVGSEPDPTTGAVVPTLSVATTFKQDGIGKDKGHDYSRSSNPTRNQLEELIASLENGAESLVFASGSAATAAIAYWATLQPEEGGGGVGPGGHVLAVNDVYGGTARFLSRAIKPTGLEVTYLDMEKAGEEGIRQALRPDTRIIWLEVPTNPLLLVPPFPLITKIVNSLEIKPLIVVDTTFLSPFYCTALDFADVVLTSLSKYSGGHSDIILGSLALSQKTIKERPKIMQGLRFLQNSFGASPSPRDCHLMSRSLKTLSVRMLRHGLNALRIAAWLRDHPGIEDVRYPGLSTSRAFHTVEPLLSKNARRELEYLGWQFPWKPSNEEYGIGHTRGLGIPFGGVLCFKLKGADEAATERFMTSLHLAALAESLGGVESLVEAPAGMTHASLPAATREALGITSNLIRLSVGIEDVYDLIEDMEQAMKKV